MTICGKGRPRAGFDWQWVAVLSVATAALSVGLAAAFLHSAATSDVGPTAATLEDVYSVVLGACLGLLLGSAAAALIVRRGSGAASGIVVGFVAYCIGVAPYLVLSGSSDVSLSEDIEFVLLVLVPAAAAVLAGTAVGGAIRSALSAHKPSRRIG